MTALEVCNKWKDERVEALRSTYLKEGFKASGKLGESFRGESIKTKFGFNISFYGNRYVGVLTDGRQPNKNKENIARFARWAGSTFIKEWVQQKQINLNPYAVAYSIARKGIKVPNPHNKGNLISDSFPSSSINQLATDIALDIASKIELKAIK